MVEVIKIFESIKNTSSLNDKKNIIAANKDNELFKKCLSWLIDGNKLSGISTKKINKKVYETDYFMPSIEEVLRYFEHHNTGTDDDIARIQSFIRHQSEECQNFYTEFLTKSYKLGCDAKVINSVIPGLIPTFDVMLGTPIDKCKLVDGTYISISHKMNGTRCVYIDGQMKSRQNKLYKGLDHIISDIKKLGMEDMFIDGELVYKNEEGLSDSDAFQVGTGIAMAKDSDKTKLKLVIFDIFPKGEFLELSTSKKTYKERRKDLVKLDMVLKTANIKNISVVELLYEGNDHSEIWKWLEYADGDMGWEGIMLNLDTPYECKRTKNLIKVKKFFETSLRCVGINIAQTGKYKDIMGSITCKFKNGFVDVGSGFSDTYRKYYTENPNEIVNHIISVKYKETTTNKNGNQSLQFPVFCGIQLDRDMADDEG